MNNIIVSIVIPFKINNLIFFDELICKLTSFSNPNYELIFVDDFSNEKISKVAETKISQINNAIYLRNDKNYGVSYSRNRGIKASNGEYILFVDSDDLISVEMLNDLLCIIKATQDNTLLCLKMQYFDIDCKVNLNYCAPVVYKTVKSSDAIRNYLYFDKIYDSYMFKSACGKVFSKKILIENNLSFNCSLNHYEDALFVSEYCSLIDQIALLDGATFYFYRKNNSSASNKHERDLINQISNYFNCFKNSCPEHYHTLILDTIYLFLPYLIKNDFIINNKIKFKDIKPTLAIPFISEALSVFKKIKLQGCINQYLIRLQLLTKFTPRFIWANYICFVSKKYLLS